MEEVNFENWTGYIDSLGNGDRGAYKFLETHYDKGKISDENTYMLDIDKSLDSNNIPKFDEDGNELDIEKIIYAHPSRIALDSGLTTSVRYSGRREGEKISDSALLIVNEEVPAKHFESLESVGTFLAGDQKDQELENNSVVFQVYPMV